MRCYQTQQMDKWISTVPQIQKDIFLASEMSCNQLLKQVMSQNNNWPKTEEMSNYILHAPLGGFTALLTAPQTFEVQVKNGFSIHYCAIQNSTIS